MSVFFCIAIVIIIILSVQLKFDLSGTIDAYKNDASFKVKFFGIPLFKIFVCMGCGQNGEWSVLITTGTKTKELHLNRNKDDKDSIMSQKIPPIFGNLLIENLKVNIKFGTNDSFVTTMLMGGIKILFYSLFSVLKTYQNISIEESFTPVYNSEAVQMFIGSILSISFADIIFGLIYNGIKKLRRL